VQPGLEHVRAFLTVAEELHFGRSADRLRLSQPRVSRLVAALEAQIGAPVFERTSRRVLLTPLGERLESRLRPAYQDLVAAFDEAYAAARGTDGTLRLGQTLMAGSGTLRHIIDGFERRHPECRVIVTQLDLWDPYTALRRGEVDVVCNWLVVDEPDLTVGPLIEERERMLAVSRHHRLAGLKSVSVEHLADETVQRPPHRFPRALADATLPPYTPSGRPIRRAEFEVGSLPELVSLIARGTIVAPTVGSVAVFAGDADLVLIPFTDLPPLPLGLIWSTAHENARIRAFADTVRAVRP
jgi:DNA-binding transcriptional LysR family regulator